MSNKRARRKRAKTRAKFKARGRKTVNQLVRGFKENELVQVCIDPSVHAGMPAAKYHGFAGRVVGARGGAFEVMVSEGSLSKVLVVHAAHLKPVGVGEA
jgi:large subunit ribosomal protein L21e